MSEKDNMLSDSRDVCLEFKRPQLVKKPAKKSASAVEKPGSSSEINENPEASLTYSDIQYKMPSWSGLCPEGTEYALEVLKSGRILEKLELTSKPYYVFGRLSNCEINMAHPTISRYHAVLQYKVFDDDEQPTGWYIYDLGSTHGTFLNRQQVKEKHYTRVRVGHQIKFGLSSRIYIMLGPDFDAEGESSLTVTEIKKRAAQMLLEREKMRLDTVKEEHGRLGEERPRLREVMQDKEHEKLKEEALRREKERNIDDEGIDWGMGDEPEEEPDLSDNPFASTANEELYLQDPKKTLRGFFAREGIELVYDCVEKGVGQFSCSVELPIDDAQGRPVIAEVIHRGKKKDTVVSCALEACRILDRVGLLRQAKHESRRRKERDWSADDYYDSDEDSFFDRTGNVEKKRHARMEKLGVMTSQSTKPPDYYDLAKKIKELESNIAKEEESMESKRQEMRKNAKYSERLDDYMKTIDAIPNYYQTTEHKEMISKSKLKVKEMQAELIEYRRLAEVARPVDLPQLVTTKSNIPIKKANSIVYGKRIRLKESPIKKLHIIKDLNQVMKQEEFVEEVDSDEEPGVPIITGVPKEDTKSSAGVGTSKENISPSIVPQTSNEESQHSTNMEVQNSESRLSPSITNVSKETRPSTVNQDDKKINQNSPKTISGEQKKVYGPMRPPANYVIPDNYYDQETDRDLPEIIEDIDT